MGELAALTASALWAVASTIFARLGLSHAPIVMNLLKCVIALAFMSLSLFVLSGALWPEGLSTPDLIVLAASGFIGLTIGDTAFFSALRRIGARRTLLLSALVPPATAIFAVPLLGESLTGQMMVGMLLTLMGVIWVVRERAQDAPPGKMSSTEATGFMFALVAVLCQSSGNVLTKLGAEETSALGISVVRLAAGVVGLAIYVAAKGRLSEMRRPFQSRRDAGLLVVATFLGTYLGIWLLNAGLKYTSHTGIAATLSSTSPIFVLPLAYLVDGEKLSVRAVLGACIAVGGIAVLFAW